MSSLPEDADTNENNVLRTWRAMEQLTDAGLVRAIGVANFTVTKLQHLLKHCRIRPAVNQFEAHPYLQRSKLVSFCLEQRIEPQSYWVFGESLVTSMLPVSLHSF